MRKEDLSTDTTFDPCWFSLDYTFNQFQAAEIFLLNKSGSFVVCADTESINIL